MVECWLLSDKWQKCEYLCEWQNFLVDTEWHFLTVYHFLKQLELPRVVFDFLHISVSLFIISKDFLRICVKYFSIEIFQHILKYSNRFVSAYFSLSSPFQMAVRKIREIEISIKMTKFIEVKKGFVIYEENHLLMKNESLVK